MRKVLDILLNSTFSRVIKLSCTVTDDIASRMEERINNNLASGIQLQDGCKFAVIWRKNNDVKICRHDVSTHFFGVDVFLLSSLVTGPSFVFVYKGLTRYLEIGNIPV